MNTPLFADSDRPGLAGFTVNLPIDRNVWGHLFAFPPTMAALGIPDDRVSTLDNGQHRIDGAGLDLVRRILAWIPKRMVEVPPTVAYQCGRLIMDLVKLIDGWPRQP